MQHDFNVKLRSSIQSEMTLNETTGICHPRTDGNNLDERKFHAKFRTPEIIPRLFGLEFFMYLSLGSSCTST
jgi:hypothetical protein